MLLYGSTESPEQDQLKRWLDEHPEVSINTPDFHRMQLEHWIYSYRPRLEGKRVMDVGQWADARRWVGDGYFTFGLHDCEVAGDLLAIPFPDESLDAVIASEVFEHCADPFKAIREIHRILKPGGLFLGTTPLAWCWHGTDDYKDYWRFTHEGWELLLKEFSSRQVFPTKWTKEGAMLYDLLRRFECMGMRGLTYLTTGLLVEAVK